MSILQTLSFDKQAYFEKIEGLFSILKKADKIITQYIFFHVALFLLSFVEILFFVGFFALLGKSTVLAFLLALFFLTIFAFFVLRLYLQTRKPEQLIEVIEEYVEECKKVMGYQEGVLEHHMTLGFSLQKLAQSLHEREYGYYSPPKFLFSLGKTMEKFSAYCHWYDLHQMKEYILIASIDELIKAVHLEPINLEIHTALANAYVMLSSIYGDPRKYEGYDEEKYFPEERLSNQMQERFRDVATRAIEEFKILNDYAPDDPWVHRQLAYSYHDLQMPEEEVKEYEKVLSLCPEDKETLFKLGLLYFQQGKNALGLRVYESLKKMHYKKAESLIKFYGN